MGNLKIKDGAKILYNLYKDYFNRLGNKEIYVSLELTKKQKEEFWQYACLTNEEIWVYANRIINLSERNVLLERENDFSKMLFLNAVVSPLLKVFIPKGKQYTVKTFILCNRIDDMAHLSQGKFITVQDAEIVVNNVINYLEK